MENSNKDLVVEQDLVLEHKFGSMDIPVLETKDNVSVLSEENDINKSMSSKSRMERMDGRLDIMDVRLDHLSMEMRDGFKQMRQMIESFITSKNISEDNKDREQSEFDDPKTEEDLKKYKNRIWENFGQVKKKLNHIEDGLSHNYGEMNKLNSKVEGDLKDLREVMDRVTSAVVENKMDMDQNVKELHAVMKTYVEDAKTSVQFNKSNITSYWRPHGRGVVNWTPEEAIKDLIGTTSQMHDNLSRMEKVVEGVQKKVNDAE
jgi:uncharacterized protein YoxC